MLTGWVLLRWGALCFSKRNRCYSKKRKGMAESEGTVAESDDTRYYILRDREPAAVSAEEYKALMEHDPEHHTVRENWLALDDGEPLNEPHARPGDAVVCVTTYFNGIGDDYHFFTELWSDAVGCCEQEKLAGYMRWDDALVGHDLIVRLLQMGRLSPCTCGNSEGHLLEEPRAGILGR
jgi:hypothetical protein